MERNQSPDYDHILILAYIKFHNKKLPDNTVRLNIQVTYDNLTWIETKTFNQVEMHLYFLKPNPYHKWVIIDTRPDNPNTTI